MKELTIEQKAKAYDEAIEKLREFYRDYDTVSRLIDVKEELANLFPELKDKESEDEKVRKELIDYFKENNAALAFRGISNECVLAWLEKQGKQKPAEKVEPKFKAGDWVINKLGDSWHIDSFDKKNYQVSGGKGNYNYFPISKQDEMHLWNIQDAKDGDVLCYKDEISLYKHDIKNCTKQETTFGGFVYYCCYDGKRFIMDSLYSLTEQDKMDIHPSTKEQRDTLFKAMTDAGYTFDFKSKEVKKIEQKPIEKVEPKSDFEQCLKHIMEEAIECGDTHNLKADAELLYNIALKSAKWSEEDEKFYNRIYDLIHTAAFENYDVDEDGKELGEYAKITNWFKSIKDRVQPKPKQEWNEEDEKMRNNLIRLLIRLSASTHTDSTTPSYSYPCEIDWLKSLRPQKQWKPNEAQMQALKEACDKHLEQDGLDPLYTLYEHLKKL